MDLAQNDCGFERCTAHLDSQKQVIGMRLDLGVSRKSCACRWMMSLCTLRMAASKAQIRLGQSRMGGWMCTHLTSRGRGTRK